MSKKFSETLRQDGIHLWEKILTHPFIQEIQAGILPIEKFRYYIVQDFHYIEGYGRVVSIALSKAPDTQARRKLVRRISTPVERPLHSQMFELLDIDEAVAESANLSPTNIAYVNHILSTAQLGGVGEAAAALLPCPWTYNEMGKLLSAPDHPIYGPWIRAYHSGFLEDSANSWRELVDRFGVESGLAGKESMRSAFITSLQYEYGFWTMAYNEEKWPVG